MSQGPDRRAARSRARELTAGLLVLIAAVLVAAVVLRPGTPRRDPIDIDSLASYPPIAAASPSSPPSTATATPSAAPTDPPPSLAPGPTPPASGEVVVLTGAGDIASCERTQDEATAELLPDEGWIFTSGDNAYESGSAREFEDCFDPTWGRHRERMFPSLGNHDIRTTDAAGYFDYFGERAGDRRAGWYSLDVGTWRLIVLNSNCEWAGGCDRDSDQGRWLARELERNPSTCTLAVWHAPRWSTGYHGPSREVAPFWDALHEAGVELVVNGHEHDYQRFVPLDPAGVPDEAAGIRQIIAGTGGAALRPFERDDPAIAARETGTYGVLRLELAPGSYAWEFVPVPGSTFEDAGTGTCH